MFSKKINKKTLLLLGLFVALFAITRVPTLGDGLINPDGVNWHWRSEQFVVGLKHMQFERTFQHYQPGITLMWIMGPAVELVKQVTDITTYNHVNFEVFHYVSNFAVGAVQLVLSIILIYLLSEIFQSFNKGLFIVSLMSFEPFFIGNSRIVHMDVLLTLFLMIGLSLSYLYISREKVWYGILSGVFMGLAVLTKSIGVGGILFVIGMTAFYQIRRKESLKKILSSGLVYLTPFLVTVIALLPALWVDAKYVFEQIYDGIERVGIRKGHGQIMFGEYTRDAGPFFYPIITVLKFSPVLILGLLVYVFRKPKIKVSNFTFFLTVFFLGYLAVMTYSTKKIDRYILPMIPYFATLAVFGYYRIYEKINKKVFWSVLSLMCLGFLAYPFVKLFPYNFTYTSPVFGSAENAQKVVWQKEFGVGIFKLKEFMLDKYGYYPTVGVTDPKPLEAIYKNSQVFDTGIDGTRRYDLLVLFYKSEIPDKIQKSGYTFNHDSSVFINGLEYWKIYVKDSEEI